MLIKRLITGAVLLAVFFCIFFFTSATAFFWIISALLAVSAWEWGGLIGLTSVIKKLFLVALYLVLAFGMFWLPVGFLLMTCSVWWCVAFITIVMYANGKAEWAKRSWVGVLMGIPALGSAYIGFNVLRNFDNGAAVVFYFVLLIASADSFAYFIGRAVGRRKLLEILSPNKTWEGFMGGFFASALVAVAASVYFQMSFTTLCLFVGVSLIAVLFSVVGDLFISLLKRQQQLKDTGKILPGHGGLLDRIDGLNAAVSIFALGLILITLVLQ